MTRERPILFTGPMVRAILNGRKTQTRRVCKGQRELSSAHDFQIDRCPYGQPGDRLWVREAWRTSPLFNDRPPRNVPYFGPFCYEADNVLRGCWAGYGFSSEGKPRPSIHMPRWASRITLKVHNVRVERLQDMSRGDAMEEGCHMASGRDPRHWYADLWDSINGPGSWDANPLVWIVEFRRVT